MVAAGNRNDRLFTALQSLLPVDFVEEGDAHRAPDGAVFVGISIAKGVAAANEGLPCLLLPAEGGSGNSPASRIIQFGDSSSVPPLLKNRGLSERQPQSPLGALLPNPDEIVVASCEGQAVWVKRPAATGRGSVDRVSVPLPVLDADHVLSQYLGRDQFLGVLPLLLFLKALCGDDDEWSPSPRRACLVFDDLNLRRATYGCVDFRAIAQSALERRYHAAVALIPLDANRVQPETAALFRDRPDQLSILIHGNDHLKLELARERPAAEQLAILAEARRRMAGVAARHALSICPIAEPPYGVFRSSYVQPFVSLGYEAVLCTIRQFLRCNPPSAQSPAFGLLGAECLAGGLAMIPRIPAAEGWETESVLAAILGQPIVIAGHHFDADDNLRFIEELADYVNGLGPVAWSNLSDVASSRYAWRREGSTLRIRASSRHIVASLPDWVDAVVVERPWVADGAGEVLRWSAPGQVPSVQQCGGVSASLPIAGGRSVEIVSPAANPVDPMRVAPPRASPWPMMRRMLAEARDRSYPYLPSPLRQRPGFARPGH